MLRAYDFSEPAEQRQCHRQKARENGGLARVRVRDAANVARRSPWVGKFVRPSKRGDENRRWWCCRVNWMCPRAGRTAWSSDRSPIKRCEMTPRPKALNEFCSALGEQ